MMKKKKAHSFASYQDKFNKKLWRVDVEELAETLLEWGKIPLTLNDTRAMEIAILAEAYLNNLKELQQLRKDLK